MLEGVLFAYFAIVGSQIREGNWISILLEFTCLVDVNLVALYFSVAILLCSKTLAEVLSHPRREKLSRCNMLMEKVNVAFSVLMITFMHGTWRMHG
jgi:hypothetical protein